MTPSVTFVVSASASVAFTVWLSSTRLHGLRYSKTARMTGTPRFKVVHSNSSAITASSAGTTEAIPAENDTICAWPRNVANDAPPAPPPVATGAAMAVAPTVAANAKLLAWAAFSVTGIGSCTSIRHCTRASEGRLSASSPAPASTDTATIPISSTTRPSTTPDMGKSSVRLRRTRWLSGASHHAVLFSTRSWSSVPESMSAPCTRTASSVKLVIGSEKETSRKISRSVVRLRTGTPPALAEMETETKLASGGAGG
mmetsp:Transcript_18746/g.61207  ORF Transcript_18746/g.61207 Transcript_18746/m.61207 type:complete len:256 (+) Transcript_18746:717-1484(+)